VNQKLTSIHKRGVDFKAGYRFPLPGWGSIVSSFQGTRLMRDEFAIPAEGS